MNIAGSALLRIIVASSLASLISCDSTNEGPPAECSDNDDCAPEESCVNGWCWELCIRDTDCFGYCDGFLTHGAMCVNTVCVAGECEIDPACDGVTCDTPPGPECIDANTLRTYQPTGVCEEGECGYAAAPDTTCPNGCNADQCNAGGPCDGITCTTPPAPSCDSGTKTFHSNPGTCAGGDCSYAESTESCTWMCKNTGCLSDTSYTVDCGGIGGFDTFNSIETLIAAAQASNQQSCIRVDDVNVYTGFGPCVSCSATVD